MWVAIKPWTLLILHCSRATTGVSIRRCALVAEGIAGGVTGTAAVIGEVGLGIGLNLIVVGWTEGQQGVAEAGLEERGHFLCAAGGIGGNGRRKCISRHFSPVTISWMTCSPGAHENRLACGPDF